MKNEKLIYLNCGRFFQAFIYGYPYRDTSILCFAFFSTYQNKYAFDQNAGEGSGKAAVEIDKEIAAKYEGILTDEKVRQ